jgi:FkbM family methyltransferase
MRAALRRALRGLGLYDWLKEESVVYDFYRYLRSGTPLNWRAREVAFYRNLLASLPAPLLVFDLGAHRGRTTQAFLSLGARVVAVEPDERSRSILARRFGAGRPGSPVTLVGMAASDSERRETLWVAEPGAGINTLSEKWVATLRRNPGKLGMACDFPKRQPVSTTTLDALIAAHGKPHYVKIDVEGHEAAVLRGLTRPVPIVSFEANLPEFRPEALDCVWLLDRLAPGGSFNLTLGDSHQGFAAADWQSAEKIRLLLRALDEATVEVYWRAGRSAA